MSGEHHNMDRANDGASTAGDGEQKTLESNYPWYGQPSDRGRLKTRQEVYDTPEQDLLGL